MFLQPGSFNYGLVNRLGLRGIVRRLGQLLLGVVGGLVPRVTACGGLELGHSGIDGLVASSAPLIHLAEHGGRLEAGPWPFCQSPSRPIRPSYQVLYHVVPSGLSPTA